MTGQDGGNPPFTTPEDVTIIVKIIRNKGGPYFVGNLPYVTEIDERKSIGESFFRVEAKDDDPEVRYITLTDIIFQFPKFVDTK